ncbi:MAG: hypothetical protein UV78_C0016G0019 [Parcubacteria group bacterium GW2011_GWA2_43_17]|nr:MAG: hypothetical protein UV78_C0016G0019 [Parcubacteria group bacterium GW2011_GWA2_43_17]KKT91228.1 MAG: hypothetical protein UW91_C0036G0020 [Parcubacteria group bacterium GW2011_GWF2_45_11]
MAVPQLPDFPDVVFRCKSRWQPFNCINQSYEYRCNNESSLEAVCGGDHIRCCADERCRRRAATMARLWNSRS